MVQEHIQTVVGHYKGKVSKWLLCSENIIGSGLQLTSDFWLKNIGADFVDHVYQRTTAAE